MAAPDGLKVGDKFLEGNLVYEVTAVVNNGIYRYSSRWTGETSSSASVEQPKKEVKKEVIEDEKVDYLSLPYAQLKKLCADKGLDAKGSKADLIARLEK